MSACLECIFVCGKQPPVEDRQNRTYDLNTFWTNPGPSHTNIQIRDATRTSRLNKELRNQETRQKEMFPFIQLGAGGVNAFECLQALDNLEKQREILHNSCLASASWMLASPVRPVRPIRPSRPSVLPARRAALGGEAEWVGLIQKLLSGIGSTYDSDIMSLFTN